MKKLFKRQLELYREEFGEESGIYYGKDFEGDQIYIPTQALEDIEQFLSDCQKEWVREIGDKIKNMETMVVSGKNVDSYPIENAYIKKQYILKLLEDYEK